MSGFFRKFSKGSNKEKSVQGSPSAERSSEYSLKHMDPKNKDKHLPNRPRKKYSSSESSQTGRTGSMLSTAFQSQGEEKPLALPLEDYFKEPSVCGSKCNRSTSCPGASLPSSLLNSTSSSRTPPGKLERNINPGCKDTSSSGEVNWAVEHQRELVKKYKALQRELEVVKKGRDQGRQDLEDERAKVKKLEEDHRALYNEKEKYKEENKKLQNKPSQNKSQMKQQPDKTHQKSTDPSLPECDKGSSHHSSPEQRRAELNGEVGIQRHNSFHSKKVEQSVKALGDKTRHLGYDVEACVSPVRPQAELVTSREDFEKLLKEKEEEIKRLNQTITELRQSEQTRDIEESSCPIASQGEIDEVKSLRKEVARLQNDNHKQKQTLSATNDALRQLQEEKTSHQQQLQSLKEELSGLQGENKTAKAKHVAAQSNVKPSHVQERSHEEELISLGKDRDRLQKENKHLEAENRKLQASISGLLIASRQRMERLCEEKADKQQQMEPLQKENKELKADKTKLLKSLEDHLLTANHRIEELDAEKAEAHRQVKLLQKKNEDLKGEKAKLLESVNNQLLTTNHWFEELDVEKAEAHRQVKLLQAKNEELEVDKGELQDQLRLANQQRDQLCAQKVQLQEQVESLRCQTSNYPGEIAKVKDDLKSTKRRMHKLEEELDAAKEEIEARIQHEAKITREFRTSVEEKGKLEKEIKTLQDQCEALQVQLEVNRVDFEQERSDRASAAGRYAEQEEELSKIIKKTGEELGRKTEEAREIGIDRDRLKGELLQLKEVFVANKRQLTNLGKQLTQSTAGSQGLEVKLQKQETQYRQLEQQLRREINDLKRQNANLTRDITRRNQMRVSTSPHRSGNEDRYQGQLGKEGEDVDLLVATLRSENSYLKEENKRLQSNFDDQYQMLSRKFLDSQRTVTELQQKMRDLQEQQIPYSHYQVLNNKYISSQRRISELEQEIRDLMERPLRPLPNQAVIQRGVGGPVNPKRQNVPAPLEFNHRVDEVERDSHSNSPRARHNVPHAGSNYGYSDGVKYGHQNIMDDRLEGNFPHVSPLDRTYRKGVVDDTPSPPLDGSGSLPSPMHLPVQHSLSSDSDTSFQPNQRYIGDGINREIRHEARQYKKAAEQGVPAPDDIDESVWPFDPNLECPHCGKRFRRGQIREYRYHLDDEHSPSLM